MNVFTLTCPTCGTVVAANELERRRVMHCPGLDCGATLRFTDLPEEVRSAFLDDRERYRM
ncbi:hypothetical protein BRC93_06750 [Halobacteriales archaeon QS_5_70_15]|jgi:uncharacterized paraquat-inducible protein A|nr:MAG: hypothetical protein BRC93_06750 [Halobacteriales archaeon QS_5_70_15]